MKTTILLSAFTASTYAQYTGPVHGCEWVPSSVPITNFTFTQPYLNSSTTATTPSSISWQVPNFHISCNTTYTGSPGRVGNPTYLKCTSPGDGGMFVLSADGANATIYFKVYEQCAADIFAFHYEAVVEMECEKDEGREMCMDGGNVVANVTSEEYLPPIRNPPPPPCTWC
jgi:hypothetical protein